VHGIISLKTYKALLMRYLITGGTGLLGKELITLLLNKNHKVSVLSRSKRQDEDINYFVWDIENSRMDEDAVVGVDVIIHLAGAGIADEKWTDERKKEIIDSRIKPLLLLSTAFRKKGVFPKKIISASAIGYYGFDTRDIFLRENSPAGKDYISDVVVQWENAVNDFAREMKCEAVKQRIGIVLSKDGGALPSLALPVKLGVGSAIANGNQWLSWIHWKDLIQLFYNSSHDGYLGVYNAVATHPVRNNDFVKTLGKILKRPIWAPNVPKFALKLLLGERAQLVAGGNLVSNERLLSNGFQFEFNDLESALIDIYD
jgi:uncharacterized protein (TIGR01777 family)